MENWIERVSEPRVLFLAWQAPDHLKERFRWAIGTLEVRERGFALRYFQAPEFSAHNPHRTLEQLAELGYRGYPGYPLSDKEYTQGVFEALLRRLPPRSRPDFEAYRRQFRLSPSLQLTDYALLAITEAKLPSDGFSVVDPLDPAAESCDLMLEVAGYRYYCSKDSGGEKVGDSIAIQREPGNQFDPNAIQICAGSRRIGYINRLQAPTFVRWLENRRVTGVIERLNGNAERPRAFIFVKVRPGQSRAAA